VREGMPRSIEHTVREVVDRQARLGRGENRRRRRAKNAVRPRVAAAPVYVRLATDFCTQPLSLITPAAPLPPPPTR